MKATIDVPDPLYRRVKAQAALDGRSVRDVTTALYERWLAEVAVIEPDAADRPAAAAAWLRRWVAIGERIQASAPAGGKTRDVLIADRR